jgi:hypothetical protein
MVSLPRNDKKNISTHQIDKFNVLQWLPAAFTLFFQTLDSKNSQLFTKVWAFLGLFFSF